MMKKIKKTYFKKKSHIMQKEGNGKSTVAKNCASLL